MNRSITYSIASIATLLIPCGVARAQEARSDGGVLAIAHGFSVDGASAVPNAGPQSLLFARSELSAARPDDWPIPPGLPDFTTVLDGLALDVDAFSIGYDYIQSTALGVAVIPPGHWAGLTFSVTRATLGSGGGRIAEEVVSPGGAAGDVFLYVLPDSALPPELVDRTMRNQDSREINIDAPGAPGDIDAHDIYVSLFFHENPWLVPTLPFVSVWFSVRDASVPAVPAAWWGAAPASGATILRRDWIAGAWSPPYPAFTPADLGLDALEDVDALAVDVLRSRMLFSTTRPAATPGAPLRDPVLFHQIGTLGHVIYRTARLTPVSTRLGLDAAGGIDDVDGICALDPGPGSQPRLDRLLGTPRQALVPSLPSHLTASVFRRLAASGTHEEFVSYASGWPQPGVPEQRCDRLARGAGCAEQPLRGLVERAASDPGSPYVGFGRPPGACDARDSEHAEPARARRVLPLGGARPHAARVEPAVGIEI
jgi:hypothetical protein